MQQTMVRGTEEMSMKVEIRAGLRLSLWCCFDYLQQTNGSSGPNCRRGRRHGRTTTARVWSAWATDESGGEQQAIKSY